MSHGEARGFEIADFLRAFCRDLTVPRKQSGKGKQKFDCSGGKHSGLRGKCVSRDERAVPDVQIGHVARCVTRRKNGLKGADVVAVVEKDRWSKFHARETEQLFPCFTCVERKVFP